MKYLYFLTSVITFSSCDIGEMSTELHLKDSKAEYTVRPIIFNGNIGQALGADIKLSYISSQHKNDSLIYNVCSTYKQDTVGFKLTFTNSNFGKILFSRDGAMSDNFLNMLREVYGVHEKSPLQFTNRVTADCLDLGEYVDSLNKSGGTYVTFKSYKIFFQNKWGASDPELYLNIDTTEHWIEIAEKDQSYRRAVLQVLNQH